MLHLLAYIHWNPDLMAFQIGSFGVRWYGLCWLIGLALAYIIVKKLYKDQHIKEELFEPLFLYCFVGILVGARLGHCLFYEPDYFLSSGRHLLEMFLPIHFVDGNPHFADNFLFRMTGGSVAFTGYEGLASHGGTIGLIIALWYYYRRTHLNLWQVLDNIAIATPVSSYFIG